MGSTTLIVIGAIAVRLAIYFLAKDTTEIPNSKLEELCDFIHEPAVVATGVGREEEPLVIAMDSNSTTKLIAENSYNWACYFGDSYYEMRDNFRSAAAAAGLEVHSYPLPSDPVLTTDVVVIEGHPDNEDVVLHISGTHGPEGYSGSATQFAFLRQYALCRAAEQAANTTVASVCTPGVTSDATAWPTIVLVHANNAYGFANNRRFTRENVDLNRNFLTPEQFAAVTTQDHNHAGYMTLDPTINPTEPPLLPVPDSPFTLESIVTFSAGSPFAAATKDSVKSIQRANAAASAVKPGSARLTPPMPAPFSKEWRLLWRVRLVLLANEVANYVNVAVATMRYGLSAIKFALVSGNYYKPTGVYYGGTQLTESATIMRRIADEHVNNRKMGTVSGSAETCKDNGSGKPCGPRAAVIDVHTGLGESGVDTIVVENGGDRALFESIWPTEHGFGLDHSKNSSSGSGKPNGIHRWMKKKSNRGAKKSAKKAAAKKVTGGVKDAMVGGKGAMSGYDAMKGGVCNGFVMNFLLPGVPREDILCMTQEFGTLHMVRVGQACTTENYAHHHGTPIEKELYGQVVKDAFFVNTPKWKQNVVRRGLSVLMQAVHHFSKPVKV